MTLVGKHHHPVSAERTHVPELEQWAINQKPKDTGWTDLKLFRYNSTPLYQWWGRKEIPKPYSGRIQAKEYSAFVDPCGEPFVIHEIETPKTFEQVWAETGYQYGPDALESVKLGWKLAIKAGRVIGSTDGDAALAIGEHAFRAGVAWATKYMNDRDPLYDHTINETKIQSGWGEYDPPEDIKALS